MTQTTDPPDVFRCEHGKGANCTQCLRAGGVNVQASKIICYFGYTNLVLTCSGGSFVDGEQEEQGPYLDDWMIDPPAAHPAGLYVWEGDVWWETPDPVYGEADIHFDGAWRLPTRDEVISLAPHTWNP